MEELYTLEPALLERLAVAVLPPLSCQTDKKELEEMVTMLASAPTGLPKALLQALCFKPMKLHSETGPPAPAAGGALAPC